MDDEDRTWFLVPLLSLGVTALSIGVGSMFGQSIGWLALGIMLTVIGVVGACVVRRDVRKLNRFAKTKKAPITGAFCFTYNNGHSLS